MAQNFELLDFIRESNRIEGIFHEPTTDEIAAYVHLHECEKLRVADIETFVDLTTRRHGVNGAVLEVISRSDGTSFAVTPTGSLSSILMTVGTPAEKVIS